MENYNLDIFEMAVNISKLTKELTNGVLNVQAISSGHQRHQMSFLMVGETWDHGSLLLDFPTCQMLDILDHKLTWRRGSFF